MKDEREDSARLFEKQSARKAELKAKAAESEARAAEIEREMQAMKEQFEREQEKAKQDKRNMAKELLNNKVDIAVIMQVTGLSQAAITSLNAV